MPRPDYSELHRTLVSSSRKALRKFAESDDNKKVYAVVFDTNEEYGTVILSLNTESALEAWRSKAYAHYSDDQVNGLHGLKYNPGDFTFMDYGGVSEAQRPWAREFEDYIFGLKSDAAKQKNIELFSNAVAQAIVDLEDSFGLLDRTPDFLAFHCYHDAAEETVERLVRMTVDSETFDKVFPEIRASRELLSGIAKLPLEDQARKWVECLEAYAFQTENSFAREFFRNNLWFDILPQLSSLGKSAIPEVMQLLNRVVLEPQFTTEGSEEYSAEGAFTRCSNATDILLEVLRDVGYSDEKIEVQLLDHFRKLYEAISDSETTIGTNLRWVAATLHSLSPERYPPPDTMTVGGNRVANAAAYLIS